MKIFTNKNIIQKLIIAIVAVTLLNFCVAPMQVQAANIGGILANGIRDIALIIPDALISLAQFAITGTWIDAVERGATAKVDENVDFWQGSVKYPIIQLSPELIFSDEIELLSIDFINGNKSENGKDYIIPAKGTTRIGSNAEGEQSTENAISILRTIIASWYVTLRTIAIVGLLSVLIYIGIRIIISSTGQDKAKYKERLKDWVVAFCLLFFMHYIMAGIVAVVNRLDTAIAKGINIGSGIDLIEEYGNVKHVKYDDETVSQIWEGKEGSDLLLNVKRYLIEAKGYSDIDIKQELQGAGADGAATGANYTYRRPLPENEQTIFSKWKDLVIVRATYDPSGNSKTKYAVTFTNAGKELLTSEDIQKITNLVQGGEYTAPEVNNEATTNNTSTQTGISANSDMIEGAGESTTSSGKVILLAKGADVNGENAGSGDKILYYINYARLYCNADSNHNPEGFGFTAIYIILVVMTIMFLFRYLKRVIYVAFLTMIAPLVALTYPLDKIKDGKAQAFNMWIREYIFNVLIQPFHLLIYGVLVGGASSLAHEYWIYGVVCIAFLIPAEKLLRKFFGFDNAGTLSAAGSFAGGALFSTMLQRINRPKPKGGKDGEGDGKKGIKMNRAPNSNGRVDADAVLTGSGEPKPTSIPTDTHTKNARGGATRISIADSIIKDSNIGPGTIFGSDRENMTPGGIILPAGANDIVGKARERRKSANNEPTINPISGTGTGTFGPDRFGPADRFNGKVSAWDKNRKITTWDRLRGTNVNASDATIGMSKRSASEYRRQLAEQAAANRAARRADITDAVMGHYKEKAIKGIKELPKNAATFTRRAVVGGMAGGALALTGAAVGAASGDAGAAMKLAAAGAGAGFYGANYYGDRLARDIDETDRVANEAFWNEQNKLHQQQLSDEQFENSEENIRMLAQFQGSMEAARESMGNGDVQAFRNEGFSDIKKIGRGLKLMEEYMKAPDGDARHRGLNREEAIKRAIAVTKWEDSAGGGLYETNSRAQQVFMARTKKQIMDSGVADANKAEADVKEIIRDMAYVRFGI